MLRSMNDLLGYTLREKDGDIGVAHDFLFDDEEWVIRYMVADTRTWLPGRHVLISPHAITATDWLGGWIALSLTKAQVRSSPDIDLGRPVSRGMEQRLAVHYSWPKYWLSSAAEEMEPSADAEDNVALRSAKEITGYHIRAMYGQIGHLEDFVVDDTDWSIRFVVVDTRDWLPAKKVLIDPRRVSGFDWSGQEVLIDETREEVRNAPEYDPAVTARREDERVHPRR